MKISIVSDSAGWVLDNIAKDYSKFTTHDIVDLKNADVVWALNYWSLKGLLGRHKNIVAHVHHVNFEKIGDYNFDIINQCSACIVNNDITANFLRDRVRVNIYKMPYWILSSFTDSVSDNLLNKDDKIFIGSFQKDSEGSSDKPKMIKGPDIFVDVVSRIKNVKVILSGYSRGYVMKELSKRGVPFEYFEKRKDLNTLYDSLDWYLVTSRVEGGPQAILEASYRKVKILSTMVGLAPDVLHKDCICNSVDEFVLKINSGLDRTGYNYDKSRGHLPNIVVPLYDAFFSAMG